MKKIISACLVIAIIFSLSLPSFAYEVYPSGDGKIIVTGQMDPDYATGMVVYPQGGSQIASIGQAPQGEGEFEYILPIGVADGLFYTVIIGGLTELQIKNISSAEALEELNSASDATIAEAVNRYRYVFDFNLSKLDAVYNKEAAYTALAEKNFTSTQSAAAEFEEALADVINNEKQTALRLIADSKASEAISRYIYHFNVDIPSFNALKTKAWVYMALNGNSYTESEFESAFSDAIIIANINDANGEEFIRLVRLYQDKIGLDLSEDAEISEKVFNKADNRSVYSFSDLKNVFMEEISLEKVNQASKSNIKSVLESENDVLGILDSEGYLALTEEQKISVCQAMAGGNFVSAEHARNEFSAIVDRIVNSDTPSLPSSSSKPSSGGGVSISGGSSGSAVSGTAPKQEQSSAGLPFADITQTHWAYNAVSVLWAEKIISGTGSDTFEPDREVTREEFVKMLVGAFGLFNVSAKNIFTDIPDDDWCIKYVASAYEKGLVTGREDGTFGRGEILTRQDMATLAARCASVAGLNLPENDIASFSDEGEFSAYALNGIYTLARAGIINGVGNNVFSPHTSCTRAMAAKVCYELWKFYGGGVIR